MDRRSLIGAYLVPHVWTIDDYMWIIGVTIGGLCIIVSFIVLALTAYHLWRKTAGHIQINVTTKVLSTMSIIVSWISECVMFSTYFACLYEWCGPNALGQFYFLSTLDLYILSKLLLYTLLIYRLWSTYKGGTYAYGRKVFVTLGVFAVLTFFGLILVHVAVSYDKYNGKGQLLPLVSSLIICIMDILLGIVSMVLFVKPLFDIMRNTESVNMKDEKGKTWLDTIVRFIVLPLTALISSTIVGILLVVRTALGFEHAVANEWNPTAMIRSIAYLNCFILLSILDSGISIWCIFLNFKFGHAYYAVICGPCHRSMLKKYISREQKKHTTEGMNQSYLETQTLTPTAGRQDLKIQPVDSHSVNDCEE
mmetsp:Transcript_57414/g.95400  ORF Transcript_57414/g.95400 Transcript_57414/m.95400 type:complete len:365 (+) Transcript_57414:70-1164(+)